LNKDLIRIRVGWLTPSFAQLIDVVAALELISSKTKHLKTRVIWYFPHRGEYPYIFDYFDQNLRVTTNKFWFLVYKALSKLGLSLFVASISDFQPIALDFYKSKSKPKKLLTYLSSYEDEFKKSLNQEFPKLDLNNLCLIYSRDSSWDIQVADQINSAASTRNAFRNGSILLFESASAVLQKENYSLVRIGRSSFKIDLNNHDFFDYATSSIHTDGLDLFLWSLARFAFSSGGGANHPAFLFGTPILFLDFSENLNVDVVLTYQKIYMLPKIYFDDRNRIMKFDELLDMGLLNPKQVLFRSDLSNTGLNRECNSSASYKRVIKDFLYKREDSRVWNLQLDPLLAVNRIWKNLN
jgi:putative glycosyltransferase (TIGR04372 family)